MIFLLNKIYHSCIISCPLVYKAKNTLPNIASKVIKHIYAGYVAVFNDIPRTPLPPKKGDVLGMTINCNAAPQLEILEI